MGDKVVYIVKEDGNKLHVFSNMESATKFILGQICDFENTFISSSWRLNVISDTFDYSITGYRFYLNIFYYETTLKSFRIEPHTILD